METNLSYKSDKDVILQWLEHGAIETEYNEKRRRPRYSRLATNNPDSCSII
jgi:hypothetical protein